LASPPMEICWFTTQHPLSAAFLAKLRVSPGVTGPVQLRTIGPVSCNCPGSPLSQVAIQQRGRQQEDPPCKTRTNKSNFKTSGIAPRVSLVGQHQATPPV